MIELKDHHYFAEGLARTCYVHPENDNLCVKVGKPGVEVAHLYKEINYFKKIRRKKVSDFEYPFFAMYHGTIPTNLGEGFVYDFIRDETTNEVSKTLREYIRDKNSPFSDEELNRGLDRLSDQMIKHKIFASDFRPRNICCKVMKDNSIQLIIIDGIGHRDFFPLADWFTYFARKKVARRLKKISLESIEQHRQMLREDFNEPI